MKDFNEWSLSPEGKEILNEVPLAVVEQIWSAAKVSAINNYVGLIRSGVLIINPTQPSSPPSQE